MNTEPVASPQAQFAEHLPERLPVGLAWLALGAFAIGTESFMVAGLLPVLAADLQVSATRAGQLVLLFALSYAIGSPLMAALFARFGRRPLLIGSLAAFSGLTLAASMAHGFAQLALARVALGLVAGVFLPTASAVAASMVSPALRGRALAIVSGGGTVAVALGVPLGAWIAGWGGWRTAYVLIAAVAALATWGLAAGLPRGLASAPASAKRTPSFSVAREPGVLPALLTTMLWATGGFSFYTYIAPFLSGTLDFGVEGVSAVFFAIGIAAAIGTAAGGWATDRFGADRMAQGFALMLVVILGGLSFSAQMLPRELALPLIVGLSALWGFAGWGFGPAQAVRLIRLAPERAPMTLSLNASAVYLGIAAGSGLGGVVIEWVGVGAVGWAGAVCQLAGLGLMLRAAHKSRAALSSPTSPLAA
ncbi:putative MFS family arabinose efflux permease [Variovorax boronicumulans]|uniref:MFS transporter n=1 Tax=Variovorax boronicumulans TaxID=436515 RepID=UPI00278908A2|nr:MFS transporter [Variovorax boronicumulans]MDQ0073277.1 putative MFS family arabinose efflux permease [Variovorax boronicumulans]